MKFMIHCGDFLTIARRPTPEGRNKTRPRINRAHEYDEVLGIELAGAPLTPASIQSRARAAFGRVS